MQQDDNAHGIHQGLCITNTQGPTMQKCPGYQVDLISRTTCLLMDNFGTLA